MRSGVEELLTKLNKERERLLAALEGVDEVLAAHRFEGTEGWTSIHDAVRHVASAEASMLTVAERTVAGTYQRIEGFDLNRFNARQVEKRADEQLGLPTFHPVWGEVDVAGLLRIIAIHDGLHRKDIETLRASLPQA